MSNKPGQESMTILLKSAGKGSEDAAGKLFELAYEELKIMAHKKLRGYNSKETMHTTALVHEAYLKLFNHGKLDVENRVHFFALCARIMRQILVDYYRKKSAEKRGGEIQDKTLATYHGSTHPDHGDDIIELDNALTKLSKLSKRLSTVVECKFFVSMKDEEIANYLGVTDRTVRNDWRKARMWLSRELMSQKNNPDFLNSG